MAKKEKIIIFTIVPGQHIHKLWKNFLVHPPVGYRYINAKGLPITLETIKGLSSSKIMLALYHIKRRIAPIHHLHKIIEEWRYSRMIDVQFAKSKADLIYCINGRIYTGRNPWVVDIENPIVFFGYTRMGTQLFTGSIKKWLRRENCKAVLPYSYSAKKGFLGLFGREFAQKTVPALNIVDRIPAAGRHRHKGFNLLFTGSINIDDSFYDRGGRETVHAFLAFAKKYPEAKLIMRCHVPERERDLLRGANCEIITDRLSNDEFDALFRKADVYILPGYVGYALSILEAMSYGLPVITSDILENSEVVENGVHGFKVTPSKIHYPIPFVPSYYFDGNYAKQFSNAYVTRIADKIEWLYVHPAARRKMYSINRKKIIDCYTIEAKNRTLKKVFDKALREV